MCQGDFPYYCPVKMSHAEYAKCAKTMQSIFPYFISDCAKTYLASLVCNHPDGKAQAERVPSAYFYSACKDIPHGICALCALCVRIKYNDISERLQSFPFEDARTVRPYLSSVYLTLLNNSAQASSSRVTTRSNASGPS